MAFAEQIFKVRAKRSKYAHFTGKVDSSTSRMISSFSEAGS
jgi:hypothetical protein